MSRKRKSRNELSSKAFIRSSSSQPVDAERILGLDTQFLAGCELDAWMKLKSPAFSFYVRDWLGSATVAQMSGNAVKAYIYLLAASWLQEPRASLPSKPLALATLARCSKEEWDAISGEVLAAFRPGEETGDPAFSGRIFSERLLDESSKQLAKQRAGSLGGIAKASKTIAPATTLLPSKQHSETVAALEDEDEDEDVQSVQSIKSTESTKRSRQLFQPPTEEAALLHGAKIGLPDCEVKRFLAYHGSKGWKVGKSPMKSWMHAMQTWKINYDERRYQNNGSGALGGLSYHRRSVSEERNARIIGSAETSKRIAEEYERDKTAEAPFD